MTKDNYLKDLEDIKQMMSRSTQFISLSGLAGIMAGTYALLGAFAAYKLLENYPYYVTLESKVFKKLVGIAFLVLVLSVFTAFLLSHRKAKKNNEPLWHQGSKRLIINFSIPLGTGGIAIALLLTNGHYGLIAPMSLIFYGLACVNASKYTLRDIRYLRITEIILGLIAIQFSGYGLYFWVLGFGLCHILYGSIMYFKYERNEA
jgi:hypothetical protein